MAAFFIGISLYKESKPFCVLFCLGKKVPYVLALLGHATRKLISFYL